MIASGTSYDEAHTERKCRYCKPNIVSGMSCPETMHTFYLDDKGTSTTDDDQVNCAFPAPPVCPSGDIQTYQHNGLDYKYNWNAEGYGNMYSFVCDTTIYIVEPSPSGSYECDDSENLSSEENDKVLTYTNLGIKFIDSTEKKTFRDNNQYLPCPEGKIIYGYTVVAQ